VHHSPQAIKRYVSTFLRVVVLHRQGTPEEEIAFLTQSPVRLVKEYLMLYEAAMGVPHRREKLEEELARVSIWQKTPSEAGKKGAVGKKAEPGKRTEDYKTVTVELPLVTTADLRDRTDKKTLRGKTHAKAKARDKRRLARMVKAAEA